ncbi:DUF2023 family protein [Magnetospirillum aberrantis]|uniref:DUF2023 family protein n=1 Tax=Magnetospirillum aberrantis SpK TaxID=908842 RepID=A0A7C9UXW2_9PROT|nr:DUF2023 family protein [Magnetospirillum aberrantis]NFV79174.1 DUF2023 family protein [Magnetospirillum aberrantis SpK]
MDQAIGVKSVALRFLANHLYEYRKGVRRMFMMTLTPPEAQAVRQRLDREDIAYHVQEVGPSKVNVLFGHAAWVETASRIVTKPLARLSPAEDFMLGTLLGYDPEQQCRRFLAQSGRAVA